VGSFPLPGKVRQSIPPVSNDTVAEFKCNICGRNNKYSGESFDREQASCGHCHSNLRTRSLIGALSQELFGLQLTLPDFPHVKSLRGLGTSDSLQYASWLSEVFDYRNTFYDREPRFDLSASPSESELYDFIISSDVIEHVVPPIENALRNAWKLLKPNGVLVFTVPYHLDEPSEHYPDLHEFGLAEIGDATVLVNRTKSGELQIREDLVFHMSPTGRSLEMRIFSEHSLKEALRSAGFATIKIYSQNHPAFGIVPAETWSLPIVARKGGIGCSIDVLRDVVEEWSSLRKRIMLSKWCRLGARLKLF
jgi:SAM-dependent methyltransferase